MFRTLRIHLVRQHDAPELACLGTRHDAAASELEVEGEEDGLQEGEDGGEDYEPHFYQVWDEAVVGDVAEGLVERAEAGLEEFV